MHVPSVNVDYHTPLVLVPPAEVIGGQALGQWKSIVSQMADEGPRSMTSRIGVALSCLVMAKTLPNRNSMYLVRLLSYEYPSRMLNQILMAVSDTLLVSVGTKRGLRQTNHSDCYEGATRPFVPQRSCDESLQNVSLCGAAISNAATTRLESWLMSQSTLYSVHTCSVEYHTMQRMIPMRCCIYVMISCNNLMAHRAHPGGRRSTPLSRRIHRARNSPPPPCRVQPEADR
mmetsp:Transcript_24341/g.67802  ORF Transcript_24341/g.67802 Transcript_24341/m.67802 type:complete len:230 (-) Transcript_24341:987-1676(-)